MAFDLFAAIDQQKSTAPRPDLRPKTARKPRAKPVSMSQQLELPFNLLSAIAQERGERRPAPVESSRRPRREIHDLPEAVVLPRAVRAQLQKTRHWKDGVPKTLDARQVARELRLLGDAEANAWGSFSAAQTPEQLRAALQLWMSLGNQKVRLLRNYERIERLLRPQVLDLATGEDVARAGGGVDWHGDAEAWRAPGTAHVFELGLPPMHAAVLSHQLRAKLTPWGDLAAVEGKVWVLQDMLDRAKPSTWSGGLPYMGTELERVKVEAERMARFFRGQRWLRPGATDAQIQAALATTHASGSTAFPDVWYQWNGAKNPVLSIGPLGFERRKKSAGTKLAGKRLVRLVQKWIEDEWTANDGFRSQIATLERYAKQADQVAKKAAREVKREAKPADPWRKA